MTWYLTHVCLLYGAGGQPKIFMGCLITHSRAVALRFSNSSHIVSAGIALPMVQVFRVTIAVAPLHNLLDRVLSFRGEVVGS